MSAISAPNVQSGRMAREMLNKVPQITLYFWVIKILATTVGETAADFLATNLHFGLTKTTVVMGAFLAVALAFQFRLRAYKPAIYWLSVVLMSIFGTLVTDNMVDNFHITLWTSTAVFTVLMLGTFALWYRSERTLSIHSITTTKREAFYWLAILFTFALGTAAGDLVAERLHLGYWKSALMLGRMRHTNCSASTPCWPSGSPTLSPVRSVRRLATTWRRTSRSAVLRSVQPRRVSSSWP
jgi:uncharacterized membrane-anchored protein